MEHGKGKGQWGSQFGFLMAAIGSAVGLGNLWGFPYKLGKNGGFAFLIIYVLLVILVGVVMVLSELALGRKTGKGIVSAWTTVDKKYKPLGWFGVISPFLILFFYTMLGGYCVKYIVANLGDVFNASWGVAGADSGAYFQGFFTDQLQTSVYTLVFMGLTALIVLGGVSSGIEKFSKVAMPLLFFMLVAVIVRSVTMPGASEGIKFLFSPNWEVFKGTGWINVLASAGGQVFFSLSLGMGITVTYGSYLKKTESLQFNAFVIPFADTVIAIMAGLAIMPAVFASGLDPAAGPGLIFVTLQTVFASMGSVGPAFGAAFYFLVFIAAITSSIALLETVVAVIVDKKTEAGKPINRKAITVTSSLVIAVGAVFVSLDGLGSHGFPQIFGQGTWLDTFDLVAEGVLMPVSALLLGVIFGWFKPGYLDTEIELTGALKWKALYHLCLKVVAPLIMALVLYGQLVNFGIIPALF